MRATTPPPLEPEGEEPPIVEIELPPPDPAPPDERALAYTRPAEAPPPLVFPTFDPDEGRWNPLRSIPPLCRQLLAALLLLASLVLLLVLGDVL